MAYRVAFQTFGCKLNQLETESLADAFARAGALVSGAKAEESPPPGAAPDRHADLFVINTCTVTGKAEQKARRAIRAALAANPHGVVVVTGCYAQVEAQVLSDLDERVVVIPGEEKARIHSLAEHLGEEWHGHGALLDAVREWRERESAAADGIGMDTAATATAARFDFRPESFAFHSRPSIKVQDGCNNRCTYCRVCVARGPASSLDPALALERVLALEAAGAAEVILTGVNLSQYRSAGLDFSGLLRHLLGGSSRIALRLSSYEPDRVDAAFLEVLSEPRVRPHVHLAVQSGSDATLARMGRRYGGQAVLDACHKLRGSGRDPFVGADLIAGFPGETDEEFAETLALARLADFAWIHAFPFSPRPGTKAWDMRPRVPERVAGERVAALGSLAREGRAAFVRRQLGSVVEAVVEGRADAMDSVEAKVPPARRATSANYLALELEGAEGALRQGQAVRCMIVAALDPRPDGDFPGHSGADALARVLP